MSRVFERREREKKERKEKWEGRIFRGTFRVRICFFFLMRDRRERERDQRESNDDYSKITGDILFELSFFKYFT